MKILITANAAWNVWNFRMPIVRALQRDGHRLTVLAPRDSSTEKLQANGCRFLPLTMDPTGVNPLQDLALFVRMHKALKTERPDAILSYTIKNNIYGSLAARRTGTPIVPNITGLGTAFLSGAITQRFIEGLYRHAFVTTPLVFFQNHDDCALFVNRKLLPPERTRVLPGSGIDLNQFTPSPYPSNDTPVTFLMISRLLRDKGVIEFADAARIVRRKHPDTRFQLLGALGSDNRSAINRKTLSDWTNEGIVEYLGTTDDVRPFIAASSCVVLPSYREGAPRSLIEAAAMARPVVTTDVPGCRSVVDCDVSGFLCPPRDAESLASTLLRFLTLSQEKRLQMGRSGRTKIEREFSDTLIVDAYREAISNVKKTRGLD